MSGRHLLKISTRFMYDELVRQNVPTRILDVESSMVEYIDAAGKPRVLLSTLSDTSSAVGLRISNDKRRTKHLAVSLGIPVPIDTLCVSIEDAIVFFKKHKRVVIKPVTGCGGKGITTNIIDITSLRFAFTYAQQYDKDIIAQQHIEGMDIRLLIVAGNFQSAVERRPASIIGNGLLTVRELIVAENESENRTANYMTNQNSIDIDSCERYMHTQIDTVPIKDRVVQVIGPANLSLGGSAHEVTTLVSQEMIKHAEQITDSLQLGINGVDMIWDQDKNQYFLIEVNASPGVDMHNDPFWGTSTNALEKYVEHLIKPRR